MLADGRDLSFSLGNILLRIFIIIQTTWIKEDDEWSGEERGGGWTMMIVADILEPEAIC